MFSYFLKLYFHTHFRTHRSVYFREKLTFIFEFIFTSCEVKSSLSPFF